MKRLLHAMCVCNRIHCRYRWKYKASDMSQTSNVQTGLLQVIMMNTEHVLSVVGMIKYCMHHVCMMCT